MGRVPSGGCRAHVRDCRQARSSVVARHGDSAGEVAIRPGVATVRAIRERSSRRSPFLIRRPRRRRRRSPGRSQTRLRNFACPSGEAGFAHICRGRRRAPATVGAVLAHVFGRSRRVEDDDVAQAGRSTVECVVVDLDRRSNRKGRLHALGRNGHRLDAVRGRPRRRLRHQPRLYALPHCRDGGSQRCRCTPRSHEHADQQPSDTARHRGHYRHS